MPPTEVTLATWFDDHRAVLWGLSYRITGSTADADDVVQETFLKAHRHAPSELAEPRRWLMRVAVNAARDLLRRRKRRSYIGPWLPTPLETSDEDVPPSFEPIVEGRTLEGRYDLMESASLAFLQALEALTPTQRAVLLLCDVFDYAAAEVATVLDTSEGNVRTIHHRARRVMESYEGRRTVPTRANRERTERALQQFLALLNARDVSGIERMLAADVRTVTDANGEFTALFDPLVGRLQVARFFGQFGTTKQRGRVDVTIRQINGLPTADLEVASPVGRRPPRLLLSIDLNTEGEIANVWVIASSSKLATVPSRTKAFGGRPADPPFGL
ncbi:MAG TPA: sigma-70 family RNA polymerase sigma factor [Vicinamibacterales bacterium]|jgi:RNA polymerase sigma-70 factor (ECF subfamily)|nr:sigma-70 family RNA polymerase sigma factor [Vicinamibacterales bacterium]